jgi:hypothetical protein
MQNIIDKKLRDGFEFKGIEYIQKGIANFIANPLPLVLFSLVVGLSSQAFAHIPGGAFLALWVVLPLAAGAYAMAIEKTFRKEKINAQDFLSVTPHFGALFLAAFLQFFVLVGIMMGLVILMIFPIISIMKSYDFTQGFMASGALPLVGLFLFVFFFILLAFYVWYTFTYNYIVFGKMEGTTAMGVSRKIVMKQYTAILFFVLVLSVISAVLGIAMTYATGQTEVFRRLFEAMANGDMEALQNMQKNVPQVPFTTQVITTVLSCLTTPIYHCIIQAAFRDINELDNENPEGVDNTISHFIGKNEL